ncbi:NACHT domain-containing protein [Streptomyces sp. NPDC102278]|uniref:NACHT domain-containing protein n=1 Tax=Streptomyces sp. NPDC102278 TaxID=3366152 RepID=UPI0038189BCF
MTIQTGDQLDTYPRTYVADQLIRESSKRREMLRRIPGLSDEQVAISHKFDLNYTQNMFTIEPGSVLGLTAPMGTGKSEMANRWLSEQCQQFAEDESHPIPLWINARNVSSDLESWVAARVSPSTLPNVGVCLVLDGVDEVSKSAQLIEESEILATRWPKSRILITGRPGSFPEHLECITLSPWSEESAFEMIREVTGSKHLYRSTLPPQVADAITRPLFALLVASAYGNDTTIPAKPIALIEQCARRSLERGTTTARQSFPILRRIAVASVNNDGSAPLAAVGGEAIRHHLRDSRLVTIAGLNVSFTLSLFEQWFAADALLQGEIEISEVLCNIGSFGRWRYALALAIQTGSRAQVDEMMCRMVEWNPGAASWVIKEAIRQPFHGGTSEELPGWKEIANRLHRAMTSWRAGLGELASAATPGSFGQPANQLQLNLAVEENGKRFIYTWKSRGNGPAVTYLSDPKSLVEAGIGVGSSPAAIGENWVWPWLLDGMQDRLKYWLPKLLPMKAPSGGVVENEYMWAVIYALSQRRSWLRSDPVNITDLRNTIKEMRAQASQHGKVEDYSFQRGGSRVISRLDLVLVSEWLDRQDGSTLTPPWPSKDIENPASGWVWGFYTPERLLELTEFTFERALKAYTEIAETFFGSFGYTLNHASLLPGTLKGCLRIYEGESFGSGPTLEYYFVPNFDTETPESRVDFLIDRSDNWRISDQYSQHSRYMKRYYIDNPDRAPFSKYGWTHTALDVWRTRPATNIAYKWLCGDLSSLGWGSGIPGDLE